jgi:site-specific recombinase XerD
MDAIQDCDKQMKAIKAYNQPIIEAFQAWLQQRGLSDNTVRRYINDIDFFTEYLVYYDPLKKLDEADSGDVWSFLSDWFARKAMWSSVASVKAYLTTFKKFFPWMGETGRIAPEVVAEVLTTLKEDREEFFASVADDEDDIDF